MAGAVDFDLEYRFYDGKTRLDATELTRRFLSLHLRAVALEEKGASWDELQAAGLTVALQRINAVIVPLITATQAEIAGLNVQIAAGLALLEAKVSEAEARLDLIIAGGLPAANVAESATRVFVSPAQRTEIGQIRTDLTAQKTRIDAVLGGAAAALDTFAEVGAALAGKLDASAKATSAEAVAGLRTDVFMTPATTRDSAIAFAGQLVGDILLTSRDPGPLYLKANGAKYLKASYPELAAAIGFINDNIDTYPNPISSVGGNGAWGVAYGKGLYVAFYGSAIWTSPDLTTWTQRTEPNYKSGYTSWNQIVFANNQFVIVGSQSEVATSPDGIAWTSRSPAGETSYTYTSVAVGPTVAFLTRSDGQIKKSTNNCVTWVDDSTPYAGLGNIAGSGGMSYVNGRFLLGVYAGYDGATNNPGPRVTTSVDGVTWTKSPNFTPGADIQFTQFAYGNGVYVGVSERGNATYWSADLVTWTPVAGTNGGRLTIAFGQGIFFAGGNYSYLGYSMDGKTWSALTRSGYPSTDDGKRYGGFIYDGSRFVMGLRTYSYILTFSSLSYDPATSFAVPAVNALAPYKVTPFIRAKVS